MHFIVPQTKNVNDCPRLYLGAHHAPPNPVES